MKWRRGRDVLFFILAQLMVRLQTSNVIKAGDGIRHLLFDRRQRWRDQWLPLQANGADHVPLGGGRRGNRSRSTGCCISQHKLNLTIDYKSIHCFFWWWWCRSSVRSLVKEGIFIRMALYVKSHGTPVSIRVLQILVNEMTPISFWMFPHVFILYIRVLDWRAIFRNIRISIKSVLGGTKTVSKIDSNKWNKTGLR